MNSNASNTPSDNDQSSSEPNGRFREITSADIEELRDYYAKMSHDDFADEAQAFVDGHNDLERAAAARDRHNNVDRLVFHCILRAMNQHKCSSVDEARTLFANKFAFRVPDDVVEEQYWRAYNSNKV